MKNFFYMAAIACLALFTSCEKQGVDHTGDDTGKLYGRWVLDTKNVVTEYTSDGKTTTDSEDTNFANDHFFLLLAEPRVAMAKEGTLITFDIDDVDAGTFAYNSDLKQITFNKMFVRHLRRRGTVQQSGSPQERGGQAQRSVRRLPDDHLLLPPTD